MNVQQFYNTILDPNLEEITDIIDTPRSKSADVLLLAIAGQESNWTYRYQLSSRPGRKGPARGFWQFEKNGGVAGIMTHPETSKAAKRLVNYIDIPWNRTDIWLQLEYDDRLAVGFARLLLWTDPKPLATSARSGWSYYKRNWRPGKPHPKKWPLLWSQSFKTVYSEK